jgi:hypothetical protein
MFIRENLCGSGYGDVPASGTAARPDRHLGPPNLGPPNLGPPNLGPPNLGPPNLGPPTLSCGAKDAYDLPRDGGRGMPA